MEIRNLGDKYYVRLDKSDSHGSQDKACAHGKEEWHSEK